MKVSVIIPNYNHASFLKQRIDAVLNQTFQDFELILLDDSSDDGSKAIIEGYRHHPKVAHVLYNEKNSGSTFRQWRKGIELATGTWIWIAESDDYCDLNFLQTLLHKDIDPECGLRYCASLTVNKDGHAVSDSLHNITAGVYEGAMFLAEHLLEYNRIPNASGVIVLKALLQEALTEDVFRYRLLGDWLVWCKVVLKTKVFFSNDTCNYHRQHLHTVRQGMIQKGASYSEHASFRKTLDRRFARFDDSAIGNLAQKNKTCYYKEQGIHGCELIRNKKFMRSIPLLLQATCFPSFNTYYLKSALYWMKEIHLHKK